MAQRARHGIGARAVTGITGRLYLDPGDRLSGYRAPAEAVTVVFQWGARRRPAQRGGQARGRGGAGDPVQPQAPQGQRLTLLPALGQAVTALANCTNVQLAGRAARHTAGQAPPRSPDRQAAVALRCLL